MGGLLVAIDGPAGSGKSSVARVIARELGLANLNTGATYRAVALVALREGVGLDNEAALTNISEGVDLTPEGVLYRGEFIPECALRTAEVSAASSKVSGYHKVREILVERQRAAARRAQSSGGAVMEGRDIGTVVLPEADLKVFLSASPDERARRRALQTGRTEEIERIHEAMQKRDRQDYEREASPLKAAPDAEVLDTTGISFEAVVSRVARLARGRQGAPEEAS